MWERDKKDTERDNSPLLKTADAWELDTSDLLLEQSVEKILWFIWNHRRFVRIVIQNEKGELLVIFEKKWNCWVFPGGKVELNEIPEEAAKREVFEETNLVIEDLEIIDKKIFGLKSQICTGYLFKANKYSGEIKNKELEKITDIKFKQIDYEFAVNRLFYAIEF
jgi:8-oxo-dGTP pyrophosphatase MutT (NUDIX family)